MGIPLSIAYPCHSERSEESPVFGFRFFTPFCSVQNDMVEYSPFAERKGLGACLLAILAPPRHPLRSRFARPLVLREGRTFLLSQPSWIPASAGMTVIVQDTPAGAYCNGEKLIGSNSLFACVSGAIPPGGGQIPLARVSSRIAARWS